MSSPSKTASGQPASATMQVLVAVFCYNESLKIERTLGKFPQHRDYRLVVMDDGSTDATAELVKRFPDVEMVRHPQNRGVGAAIRTINQYALEGGVEVIVHVAGNGKDDPLLIPTLLKPIAEEGADYVQGSRYLKGGGHKGMPLYRVLTTRYVHPWLFSMIAGRRISDSTNGFRAYRTTLLRDPRINLEQDWLDKYELEPYFFYKAITLGYKVQEVPVTKIYPARELGYTKMKPITGWWSILRPIFLLGLRIKK
jgi:dolichol-phosphate mannosyltransferase